MSMSEQGLNFRRLNTRAEATAVGAALEGSNDQVKPTDWNAIGKNKTVSGAGVVDEKTDGRRPQDLQKLLITIGHTRKQLLEVRRQILKKLEMRIRTEKWNYSVAFDGQSITCHRCGRTSYNSKDVEHLYCGYCHVFHE